MEKICPKCKSKNISFSTVFEEENQGAGCFLSYIVMVLLLFIPVSGWILLFAMFTEKRKPVPFTYALCNKCGHSWKQTAKKKNRKLIAVSVLLIVIVAMAVQLYFMGKYQGWF